MTAGTIGDTEIFKLHKTAFLCSRKVSAGAVLKCYDWAVEQRSAGNCVLSGFHSQIEKDVLYYLLKGSQPIIVVLARGLKQKIDLDFIKPIEQGRLLIISPFDNEVKRVTEQTAFVRNKYMIEIADKITVGYVSENGRLSTLLKNTTKPITYIG